MIRIKDGVILPPIVKILLNVSIEYALLGHDCWITSGRDGVHSKNSLHYKDRALDFRTKNVKRADLDGLVAAIKARLGKDYDVILESRGKLNEHLHVEHDPKG